MYKRRSMVVLGMAHEYRHGYQHMMQKYVNYKIYKYKYLFHALPTGLRCSLSACKALKWFGCRIAPAMRAGDPMRIVLRHCVKLFGHNVIVSASVRLLQPLPLAAIPITSNSNSSRRRLQRRNQRPRRLLPHQHLPRPQQQITLIAHRQL